MIGFSDVEQSCSSRLLALALLCLVLVTCAPPAWPSPTPVLIVTPTASAVPASAPTARPGVAAATPLPSPAAESGSQERMAPFDGCWSLDTDDVSFELRLEVRDQYVQGSFLLVRMCIVADEVSACRIREGTLQGTGVAPDTLDIRLSIPEYDDEGTARLTLTADGAGLVWEELVYPDLGLAGGRDRYLPPSFAMIPCGG